MSDNNTDLFLSLTAEQVLSSVEAGGFSPEPACFPPNTYRKRVSPPGRGGRRPPRSQVSPPRRASEPQPL